MDPRVAARMASQHGLITRAQALDLGLSPAALGLLLRDGEWVVVRRGAYADASVWNALDPYRGQPLLRARAVLLTLRREGVLSHDSAAHALELDILAPKDPLVHLTRPGFTGAWTEYGVSHHLARFRPSQVQVVGDLRVLDAARTAVDIARTRGVTHGLAACDSAMRSGVSRVELEEALAPMVSWPGVGSARTCVDLADPGAESVGESLSRQLTEEAGLGRAETQFPVPTARGVAWCDLRIGRHMIEFDGKIKYQRREDGGVADRSPTDVAWEERRREVDVCANGLGMSRLIWSDFWGEQRERAKRRLRQEYAETFARHGDVLPPELEEFARRMRGRRRSA